MDKKLKKLILNKLISDCCVAGLNPAYLPRNKDIIDSYNISVSFVSDAITSLKAFRNVNMVEGKPFKDIDEYQEMIEAVSHKIIRFMVNNNDYFENINVNLDPSSFENTVNKGLMLSNKLKDNDEFTKFEYRGIEFTITDISYAIDLGTMIVRVDLTDESCPEEDNPIYFEILVDYKEDLTFEKIRKEVINTIEGSKIGITIEEDYIYIDPVTVMEIIKDKDSKLYLSTYDLNKPKVMPEYALSESCMIDLLADIVDDNEVEFLYENLYKKDHRSFYEPVDLMYIMGRTHRNIIK